jgi:DNA polymerase III delta subunit
VLVEPKLDKRTKTYKELKKHAVLREFTQWGDRDVVAAENWTAQEAKRQSITLDKKLAQQLVARVGLDQWQLYHALEKLAVLERIDAAAIENTIEAQPSENVFNLLDAALNGKTERVHTMIQNLQRSQDPYMTFGLLAGQVFQLVTLSVADKSSGEVAGDISAHPYALGKLAPYAKKLGRTRAKKIVTIFADADTAMKSTAADPWLLVEESLIKTASV